MLQAEISADCVLHIILNESYQHHNVAHHASSPTSKWGACYVSLATQSADVDVMWVMWYDVHVGVGQDVMYEHMYFDYYLYIF